MQSHIKSVAQIQATVKKNCKLGVGGICLIEDTLNNLIKQYVIGIYKKKK